mmetsp:Transcript_33818/g.47184  ORF Transcript_33818/g.47184 Transcript_33818/m.47184 type:complete len:333 (-) Transcript_33818:201-1199(-)|eukprot:CAMPEP_0185251916 /NCGR_PEP_ID=MMETSP1359-20130426/1203_1 /TAXON_ID=552665 /ORGANISM="Bigelowiella longifila, Strain CCMP242" /LENGTH=332 /DNA_ID=CAMNT_0027833977 /DNA_START=61 /DNA_END=1059 /DNA_ORIENTATION=-
MSTELGKGGFDEILSLLSKLKPELRDAHDALAFTMHLSFLASNMVCTGLSEHDSGKDLPACPKGWNESKEGYVFRYRTNNKKGQHEQASPTLFTVKMIRVGPTLMLYAANDEETKNTNISKNSLSHITLVVRDKIVDQSQDAWNKMRSSVWDPKELFVDLPSLMKDFDNSLLRPLLGLKSTPTGSTTHGTMEDDSKGKREKEENKKGKEKPNEHRSTSRVERQDPLASNPHCPRPQFNPHEPPGMRPNNPRRGFNPFAPDNGGMLVGPRHPGFGSGLGAIPRRPPRNPGRMPGARFDPFGPFGGGGGGGGMMPDPDHFRAPGRRGFDEDDII